MDYTKMQLVFIFIIISFSGWIVETIQGIYRNKRFINPSFFLGPISPAYGINVVLILVVFKDLYNDLLFLFLGCFVLLTVNELVVGRILESFFHRRWWDYSRHKFNLDGYICLKYSLIWGILGVLAVKVFAPLCIYLYNYIPSNIMHIILTVAMTFIIIDSLVSIWVIIGIRKNYSYCRDLENQLGVISQILSKLIYKFINFNEEKIVVQIDEKGKKETNELKQKIFAYGCGFYKIVIILIGGAFIGDAIETIFCRLTMGQWMCRSSVLYGRFSLVWGIAFALATLLLYKYRDKSYTFLFLVGTVLGGVYEYVCSVFTEKVFGTIFWDYSAIPYNLGGRINLLFCFFWGFLSIIWIKMVYPRISNLIEKIPKKIGILITWILIVFMTINIIVSSIVMYRYVNRNSGEKPANTLEEYIDEKYPDKKIKERYPHISIVE